MSNDLLYHYCSTQTAYSILSSREFRLSALSAANDSLEGRLLGQVFAELLQHTRLTKGVIDVLSVIVAGYPDATEGFALCLSEKGDLLSQWRAYARDGTGLAIGFQPDILTKDFGSVNFGSKYYELVKVKYGESELRSTIIPIVDEIEEKFSKYGEFVQLDDNVTRSQALNALADRQANNEGLFLGTQEDSATLLDELITAVEPLHFLVYGTKPQAFHEECEWRLLRFRHRVVLPEVKYFASEDSVRPFISCLIADPAVDSIKRIILGPKHKSDINWVRAFLASAGLHSVEVVRSECDSYR